MRNRSACDDRAAFQGWLATANSQRADQVLIVERLRIIREAMNLPAEEVELRAGLARSYLCDLENGQIVPSLAVLEKIATALEVPLAKLFYDGDGVPPLTNLPGRKTADDIAGVPNSRRLKKSRTQSF
jgi:transcriptional regulator with XRE-family HTH domain